ncbi:hypothetical protein BGZ46_004011 [Entomortierella lignicola]|nr:hypothetical protein BGZ46_004011 [Entomortierella lignicola]
MSNYPNDYKQGGGAPRIAPRLSAPNSGNGGVPYQPRSSYGTPTPEPQYTSQTTYGQPAPRQSSNYHQQPAFQPQPARKMRAVKSTHERYALTNYVVANMQDFPLQTHYILVDHQFVFSIR